LHSMRGRRRTRRPVRRWLGAAGLGLAALVVAYLGWSLVGTLTEADSAPFGVRWVEWLRDHGGSGFVTLVEQVWYSHHQPPKGGRPSAAALPQTPSSTAPPQPRAGHLPEPAPVASVIQPPLPGEGAWQPAGRNVEGIPAIYTTWLRPDPVHSSVVAAVAWMDPTLLEARMFAGTQEPGGTGWRYSSPIDPATAERLVATFNSGFRLKDNQGGYYSEGRMVKPLLPGFASLVIYDDGTATVGQWGRDVGMGPNVAAVRQNAPLIVDGGSPVPGLDNNAGGRWGFTVGNATYVWRSGVGVTADGALLYAAGPDLSARTLAVTLAQAGAVRAMELDINSAWVDFFYYSPQPGEPASPANATKLLPEMTRSTQRYFVVDSRDFIGMLARGDQLAHLPTRPR